MEYQHHTQQPVLHTTLADTNLDAGTSSDIKSSHSTDALWNIRDHSQSSSESPHLSQKPTSGEMILLKS